MKLLLDTHILLWWHDQPERLTDTAHHAISDLGNDVFVSVVNGWEIQIKTQLGKLTLPKPLNGLNQVISHIPFGPSQHAEPCAYMSLLFDATK